MTRRGKLILCCAIVYLVWGSTYLVTKIGVRELPPFLFGGVRFVISGVMLWAVARLLGHSTGRVDRIELRHLVIVGFCTVLLSNGFNVWGLQWVPSNQSALVNASASLWIALFGAFGRRAHAITRRVAAGLLLGFAGVALIVWPGSAAPPASGAASPYGLVLPQLGILVGCFSWAVGTIYIRNVETSLDLLSFTGLQMLCGGVMLLLLGLATGEASRWNWSVPGIAALLYMILFSSCLAYTAYAWLSQNATPAQVGSYGFVAPAIATALGWSVLDERLSGAQLLGMPVILAALVLVSWPQAERQPGSPG